MRRCSDRSRTFDAGHVIDDLIDGHPSLIDSYPNQAYRWNRALAGLDCYKKAKSTELALPINRGQFRR